MINESLSHLSSHRSQSRTRARAVLLLDNSAARPTPTVALPRVGDTVRFSNALTHQLPLYLRAPHEILVRMRAHHPGSHA